MRKEPESPEEKFRRMTETPVKRLVCTLAVPTIISMLITSIYNMADTFFIGQIGDGATSATGAVGVAFSLMAVIQAVGFMLGMGSGNFVARLLGQRENEKAAKVAATGFFTSLFVGLLITILGLIFLDPLTRLLGATETILPYAREYIRYILLGAPWMAASFVLNNLLRYQGSAIYAMLGIGTGGILNILLDPLFIFGLKMGTGGAALATIISQFISFCILLWGCGRGGNIAIRPRNFSFQWQIHREILRTGMPSFYRQGLASLSIVCLNFSAKPFGDPAIAAMAIVSKVSQFALSALLGFGQGFQPVAGFNYGAGRNDRVLDAYRFCLRLAACLLLVLAAAGLLLSPQVVQIFRRDDAEVIAIGARALRFQCITLPLSGYIIIANMLLQTIGKSGKASLLSLARQGMFFLPAIFLFPALLGLTGVQISQPVADIATFLLAIPLSRSVVKELRSASPVPAGPLEPLIPPPAE